MIFYATVISAFLVVLALAALGSGLIALLGLLFFKHFLCDYLLQSQAMLRDKHDLRASGPYLHSGLHALSSGLILLAFAPWWLALAIAVAEFVLHVLLDWGKAQWVRRQTLTETHPRYWHLFGLDQLFHTLTYVAMAALVFR